MSNVIKSETYYGQSVAGFTHLGIEGDILPITEDTVDSVEFTLKSRYGEFCTLTLYALEDSVERTAV